VNDTTAHASTATWSPVEIADAVLILTVSSPARIR
jgi:hypothetical protein